MPATSYADEVARAVLRSRSGSDRDVADLSLGDVAELVGTSRSTLIRRLGSRRVLDEALGRLGAATTRTSAADRAVAVAAHLYGTHGVGAVTLDMVAADAGCTVQAIQGQLGGRDGLLAAVLDRYSPMPEVSALLTDPPPDVEAATAALYVRVLDALLGEQRVLAALFAEVASRPHGALAEHVRESYAPRFVTLLTNWLDDYQARGTVRQLPAPTLLSLFAGPVLARSVAAFATGEPLDAAAREHLASELAAAFCRAVLV